MSNRDPRYRQAAVAWIEKIDAERSNWSLETVKHLAFVNGAGLAGTSTLLASSSSARVGAIPSVAFALGLILAVLDMHCCTMGYSTQQKSINARIKSYDEGKLGDVDLLSPTWGGKCWFNVSSALGWLSGIFFLVGIVPFVRLAF